MDAFHQFTILVVDDEKDVQRAIKRYFIRQPYQMLFADNGRDALAMLPQNAVSLILLDLKMPGMDGLDVLRSVMKMAPEMKVIMLTGHGGIKEAVTAMKIGALDFFEKSVSPEVLKKKVRQIHAMWQLEQENKDLRNPQFRFDELIGESPPMLKLKTMITRIAPTDTSVLIQGESGTGKELIARAVHLHSLRSRAVFMPVDCAAINETVMESELFGHVKGAFTGADQAALGLIRSADKGTLFLDEVGELSLTMQAKLLRTIQERAVRPVGSTKIIPADIRIVAATNRNLIDAVASGEFRQDLYYRLSAITLHAPPLRERGEDVVKISQYLVRRLEKEGLAPKTISGEALARLAVYHWPGNVRELENVIRGAMAFGTGEKIEPHDLSMDADTCAPTDAPPFKTGSMAEYEAEAIRNALQQTSGNKREAAKMLNISEATLYRRLKQYNI